MAPEQQSHQFLKSARLTDQVDGGSQITATPLPDNVSNNLFPGVSNLDAVNGRVSARLLYLAIVSPDTLWYYGAGVYLSAPGRTAPSPRCWPAPRRSAKSAPILITRVESYLTQGPITLMTFYGNAVIGQRAVRAYQGGERAAAGNRRNLSDQSGRIGLSCRRAIRAADGRWSLSIWSSRIPRACLPDAC